jgi:glycosyltransferase involved in cell wall biosynthesis
MKIALVSQPFDVVLPPNQNSVGYCTYGLARKLADRSEVILCIPRETHGEEALRACDPRLQLRLVESTRKDRLVFKSRKRLGELIRISEPVSTSSLLFPDYGRSVAKILQKERCDVIYIQHSSQFAPILRKLNPESRIVLQTHAEWFSQSDHGRLAKRLESVDLILSVSDYITQKIRSHFPQFARRCEPLYNGIDPQEFTREKEYERLRARPQKHILFTGAISPQKGPHVLLEAFRMVAKEYPDVRLTLAGSMRNYPIEESFDLQDREQIRRVAHFFPRHSLKRILCKLRITSGDGGSYQSMLRQMIPPDLAERVKFLGNIGDRSQLMNLYYDADFLVFPPIWEEGFSLPPLEAMAAGMPVVGTRAAGMVNTVLDGETGYVVEMHDPEALAERMLRLLRDDDLRERMGRAARRHVMSHFRWEDIAKSLELRLAGICDRRLHPPEDGYSLPRAV